MSEVSIDRLMKHSDSIFRFALSRVRDHHLAEDLVQECLTTAWQRRDTFQGKSPLETWLIGIMKFKVLDYFRKKARTPTDLGHDPGPDQDAPDPLDTLFDDRGAWTVDPHHGLEALGPGPDQAAGRNEILERISECLDRMPERLRLLFNLREVEGLDVPASASAAGVTPGSAAVLLTRVRQRLRACLQQYDIQP